MTKPEAQNDISNKLKRAFIALDKMETRLRKTEAAAHELLAIVGMGCRFPGGIDSPEALWKMLIKGHDVIRDIPPGRWPDCYDPDPEAPGKMYTKRGGFITNPDAFDPEFFGITPREAIRLDPQHRLLLEVAWETLENAGTPPGELKGSKTGVFLGISTFDYAALQFKGQSLKDIDAYFITGSYPSMAAGRLAYTLGLKGPAMAVDTACSSSLLALHLAVRSLRQKECDAALVGGVNLILTPETTINFCKNRMLSQEGRCFTFDERANGYVRGEGCGIVLLKRLSDATQNNDRIVATVMGTAANHDGAGAGITVPNGPAQENVLLSALEDSRLGPDDISYIEAHGTGTSLGDPIEMEALGNVFGNKRKNPLIVGAVKTNLGHTEAAAGVAGILKTALMMENSIIPPHLNFKHPNEKIDWDAMAVEIPTVPRPWPENTPYRFAGISAFGASGTNVHAVLGAAGDLPDKSTGKSTDKTTAGEIPSGQDTRPCLLLLSARTMPALKAMAENYSDFMEQHPDLDIQALCRAAATGRSHFRHRLALVGRDLPDFKKKLDAWQEDGPPPDLISSPDSTMQKPVWLFTGQGSQYPGMGKWLYASEPVFKQTIDHCDALLRGDLDTPLTTLLFPESGKDAKKISLTQYTQPVLFAFEYALAELFKHWGLYPRAVMGHSVGEYTAACVAGIMSLEDGLRLIARRGKLMGALPKEGKMAAVMAPESVVTRAMLPCADEVSVAAVNSPANTVISGTDTAVDAVLRALEKDGVSAVPLEVSHAFHSPLMAPMMPEFRQFAERMTFNPPRIPIISNIFGREISGNEMNADYWVDHVRKPVMFARSMAALQSAGHRLFMEIGPKPILSGMGRQCPGSSRAEFLPTIRFATDAETHWEHLLHTLGYLYRSGQNIDWNTVYAPRRSPRKISLPTYPFQRQNYRIAFKPSTSLNTRREPSGSSPLLGNRLDISDPPVICFESLVNPEIPAFLGDHVIHGMVIMPATGFVDMAVSAGKEILSAETLILKNIGIRNPLMFPGGIAHRMQTLIQKNEENNEKRHIFKILSKGVDDDIRAEWSLNIQGHITSGDEPQKADESPTAVFEDLDKIRSRMSRRFSPEELYAAYRNCGLELGASFQALVEIRVGKKQCLGKIVRPPIPSMDMNAGDYLLHPALLDACFQVAGPLFLEHLDKNNYLPISIDTVHYLAPMNDITYCHARMPDLPEDDQIPETLTAEFNIYNKNGQALVHIQGLKFRRTDREVILKSIKNSSRNLFHHMTWHAENTLPGAPAAERDASDAGSTDAAWLVLSETEKGGRAVARHLSGKVSVESRETLDLKTPESIKALINSHGSGQTGPPGIIALFEKKHHGDTAKEIASRAEAYCLMLLDLVQALLRLPAPPRLWIMTVNAQPVNDTPPPLNLCQTPLWGMVETLFLEHPELDPGIIDVATMEDPTHLLLAARCIRREVPGINGAMPEKRFSVRDGQVHVPRLLPFSDGLQGRSNVLLPATTKIERHIKTSPSRDVPINAHDGRREKTDKASLFKPDGTYLITGGLGALGLQVANWMAAEGARHIALCGRREPGRNVIERLTALSDRGVRVKTLRADISRQGDITRMFSDISRDMPPLKGIVHAAGIINDQAILSMTDEPMKTVLAPKIKGALYIGEAVKKFDVNLDFWVSFSSMAALLGSRGQASYAAANRFLDAMAGEGPARKNMSINWGPWEGPGMAGTMKETRKSAWHENGIELLAPEKALAAMGELLKGAPGNAVAVLSMNWPSYLEKTYGDHIPPLFTKLAGQRRKTDKKTIRGTLLKALESAAVSRRTEVLLERLNALCCDIMRLPPDSRIELRQRLFDSGMDSLMAIELKNQLERELDITLTATLVFDYPTLEAIMDYLTNEMLPPGLMTEGDDTSAEELDNNPMPDITEDMDETDLAELLAGELAAIDREWDD